MEEDIKALNYRGLAHLVERIKAFFIKNPKNRVTGRYLRCIDSDGNVEWADFPSYVNLIDGFDPTSLIIGGTAGRTLTTEAEVKGDCYIATAAGTLFPGTVSAMTLEAGDSIIFRKDVASGTSVTANDIIFIESSVNITPGTSILDWGTEITLATVEGVPIKAKLPSNPNTDTQADWNETDTNSAAYINNKPTVPAVNDATYSVKTDVSGTETVVSDFTANQSSADDITFVQGTNVTLTPDATNKKITIAATDTTYNAFSGTDAGLVPRALPTDFGKFLKADGTWGTPSGTGLTGVSFNGTAATVTGGVAAITASVGDTNVIETVKVNGSALTPDSNKAVDITVPANTDTTYKFTIGSTTYGDVNGTSLGSLASETAAASGTTLSLVTTGEKDTWNNKTSNTGTVTSVTAGRGLSGGTITSSGTIDLDTSIATPTLDTDPNDSTIKSFTISADSLKYIRVSIAEGDTLTIHVNMTAALSGNTKYAKEVIVRIDNTTLNNNNAGMVKVDTTGVTGVIKNMYDDDITGAHGVDTFYEDTLELVFTFWDNNDVTFNGGINV